VSRPVGCWGGSMLTAVVLIRLGCYKRCPRLCQITTNCSTSQSLLLLRRSDMRTRKNPSGLSNDAFYQFQPHRSLLYSCRTHPDRLVNATTAEKKKATERFQVFVLSLYSAIVYIPLGRSGRLLRSLRPCQKKGIRPAIFLATPSGKFRRLWSFSHRTVRRR